jgi:serine phosphatase RsbU (regulator of sigma subunit)
MEKQIREESLIELVHEHYQQPFSHIGDVITDAVADWTGDAKQPDDVTVVFARAC